MNHENMVFKSVGVVGHTGMVGGAAYRYYKNLNKYDVYGYSRREPDERALKADIILIGVPTPYVWEEGKRGFSDQALGETLQKIQELNADRPIDERPVVLIKSTIRIGTTEKFQAMYPELRLLFNPEFLSEASCDADFKNPDRQYVGYTPTSYKVATAVLNFLPESPFDVIMPVKEAEFLKYINNMHGALSVIESNHYYDIAAREGMDYERVMRAAEASKWVGAPMGRQYHTIYHKGFRGFGGKCFPKDVNAWVDYVDALGEDSRLMTAVRDINKDLLKTQGMSEADAEQRG